MTREEATGWLLTVFSHRFEIDHPGLHDDLREMYEFDSIDAIELLREIELQLKAELSHDEKKKAMDIRTISHIVDYVMDLAAVRAVREA